MWSGILGSAHCFSSRCVLKASCVLDQGMGLLFTMRCVVLPWKPFFCLFTTFHKEECVASGSAVSCSWIQLTLSFRALRFARMSLMFPALCLRSLR